MMFTSISFRLSSPEKRHNNEKPPLEEEKKEKIELKSITSDGEANTATKVRQNMTKSFHKAKNSKVNVLMSLCRSTWMIIVETTVKRRTLIQLMITMVSL